MGLTFRLSIMCLQTICPVPHSVILQIGFRWEWWSLSASCQSFKTIRFPLFSSNIYDAFVFSPPFFFMLWYLSLYEKFLTWLVTDECVTGVCGISKCKQTEEGNSNFLASLPSREREGSSIKGSNIYYRRGDGGVHQDFFLYTFSCRQNSQKI